MLRRNFIKAGSLAGAAGLGLIPSGLPAMQPNATPEDLFEELSDGLSLEDPRLRGFAMTALDAARSAGAQFADVRINIGRSLSFGVNDGRATTPSIIFTLSVGVRAVVDGAWGFAGSQQVNPQGVAATARLAAERARAGHTRKPRKFEFAKAPVVDNGKWEVSVQRDPFTVSIAEQESFWTDAWKYVTDAVPELKKYRGGLVGAAGWMKSERVFASTEGSFIAQQTYHAYPRATVSAGAPDDYTRNKFIVEASALKGGAYGYESISQVDVKESWRQAAEEAVKLAASPPPQTVNVGRYDLVLSPNVLGNIVADTVAKALDLDRAIGNKMNGAGTTYASPPLEMLGKYRLASDLLTVSADRSRPHTYATVGWDEEGVKPDDFTIVKNGVVVDYISTRATAPEIASWYSSVGEVPRSHGCADRTGADEPILQIPNLTVHPGQSNTSKDDLTKSVKKGFYLEFVRVNTDQQLINTQLHVGRAYEINNGKLGSLVKDMAVQFNTPKFWKSLIALGGSQSSEVDYVTSVGSRYPGRVGAIAVASVPAIVREMNVISTGKTG